MSIIREVPRNAVRTSLQLARLPLNAATSVLRRDADETERATWGPTLLFDGIEASIKQTVGSVLGDDELVREGRLEQARLSELKRSIELEAIAEQKRQAAEADLQQRRQADEAERRRVAAQADAQERRLEQEKVQKQQQVSADLAKKAAAARKVEAATDKVIARQEREARKTRVVAESSAIAKEKQAVEAKGEVIDIDRKLDATKAARKAASR